MSKRAPDVRIDDWIGFVQTLRLVSIDPSRDRARVYTFTRRLQHGYQVVVCC